MAAPTPRRWSGKDQRDPHRPDRRRWSGVQHGAPVGSAGGAGIQRRWAGGRCARYRPSTHRQRLRHIGGSAEHQPEAPALWEQADVVGGAVRPQPRPRTRALRNGSGQNVRRRRRHLPGRADRQGAAHAAVVVPGRNAQRRRAGRLVAGSRHVDRTVALVAADACNHRLPEPRLQPGTRRGTGAVDGERRVAGRAERRPANTPGRKRERPRRGKPRKRRRDVARGNVAVALRGRRSWKRALPKRSA